MIHLNYRDSRPIYMQIKDELRHLVVSGAYREGDRLPSVRELAESLSINPNTIQRAYRELESEGYIFTIAGKGSFAAPQNDIKLERKKALISRFDDIASELFYLGCSKEELFSRIENAMKVKEDKDFDKS